MNNTTLMLLAYKLATLFAGVFVCYMGYLLFAKGVFNQAGDVSFEFKDNKILFKRAAPGTFFAVFGAAIICWSIYTGFEIENKIIKDKPLRVEQPVSKPPFN
jgi:hypothetical protein